MQPSRAASPDPNTSSAQAAAASATKFRPLLAMALRLVDEGKAQTKEAAPVLAMAAQASEQLARVCLDVGMVEMASELAAQRLRINDQSVVAHLVLAEIARRDGALEKAAQHLSATMRLEPGTGLHYQRFGQMALALGWQAAAIQAFDVAFRLDPSLAESANQLAFQAMTEGRLEAALTLSQNVLAREPANRQALVNSAQAELGLGRIEAARSALARLLDTDPDDADAHLLMSRLKTYAPEDPDLIAMRQAWAKGGQPATNRSRLGFALFKALDDAGSHAEAFGVLGEANRIRHAGFSGTQLADTLAFIDRSMAVFTAPVLANLARSGLAGKRPVFILGLPRTGTTLAEQILSGHPDVTACGEMDTLSQLVIAHGLDADRKTLAPMTGTEGGARIAAMARAYAATMDGLSCGKAHITDKMPINFLWIGFIAAMFPDAAIIHMNRDPLANAFALYATTFDNQAMEWAYDLDELARFMVAHRRLMEHWRKVLPGRILDVSYEGLTENVEAETRRMLAFCGLEFDPACLNFHTRKRSVLTMSAAQVVRPVYSGRDRRTQPYRPHLETLIASLEEGRP